MNDFSAARSGRPWSPSAAWKVASKSWSVGPVLKKSTMYTSQAPSELVANDGRRVVVKQRETGLVDRRDRHLVVAWQVARRALQLLERLAQVGGVARLYTEEKRELGGRSDASTGSRGLCCGSLPRPCSCGQLVNG